MTSVAESATVFGDRDTAPADPKFKEHFSSGSARSGKAPASSHTTPQTFLNTNEYNTEDRPFFVRIGKEGLIHALQKLDDEIIASGRNKLLSTKVLAYSPAQSTALTHFDSPQLIGLVKRLLLANSGS